jgi:hypothetical protein
MYDVSQFVVAGFGLVIFASVIGGFVANYLSERKGGK